MDRAQPRAEVVLRRGGEEVARWALTCEGRPDVALVDEVARLQLAARRAGCSIWLLHACSELADLLDLVGLRDIVGPAGRPFGTVGPAGRPFGTVGPAGGPVEVVVGPAGGPLEVVGEAEGGEEAGVEEVVVPDDPVA